MKKVFIIGLTMLYFSCSTNKEKGQKSEKGGAVIEEKEFGEAAPATNQVSDATTEVPGDDILTIKKWFQEINSSIPTYTKIVSEDINVHKDINPDNYSFEGASVYQMAIANLERYYQNDGLKKAIVKFDGPQGQLVSEYYFQDNSLFFVFKTRVSYSKPKWSEDFKESDKTVTEDRFYFKDGKLIRWLVPNKEMVDLTSGEARKNEQEILSDSRLYTNIGR